jgi:heme exporter protein A
VSALIQFEQAALHRGGRLLFEKLDLAVGRSDAVRITGPNGSGKSSLIRLAAGLLQPSSGAVSLNCRAGLIDDNFAFDLDRSVGAELGFWAGLDGAAALIPDALAAFGIEPLANVPMRLLSAGQRRRAAFAVLWADNSILWLLDEPANGLDDAGLALVRREIAAHQAAGNAVIYASHQPLDLHNERLLELGR